MMNDDQLSQLLRTALPAADATAAPSRDLWPAVVRRSEARIEVSSADWSMAAIVAIVLVLFPEWIVLLAYQL
jgi:hypothetical protein